MIKPANIILTLVSTAIVGGSIWKAKHSEPSDEDDWGASSQQSRGRNLVNATYSNDYFVKGLGYYHAPYHGFYANPFNFHDEAKGYYYGGSWYPAASTSTVTSSTPSPDMLARLRQLLGTGTAVEEYPNDYYVPGMGYYHAPHHAFFPYRYNFFDSGRGYYRGGSWSPVAGTSAMGASTPSPTVTSQLRSMFSTGTLVSSSGGFHSGSSNSSSNSGGHASSSSVSRGGFGSSAHGSSSSSSSS
ncbi:MAG: hypothetical protein JWO94_370 [Verrucomicrobiaceae bacterium]|nr:hypothetical protein [Verrucomicrobiaceae bacterium]